MEEHTIMREIKLSYEELKSLDAHFRQLQKDAVVYTLKKAPSDTAFLFRKILSKFKSTDKLMSAKAESLD